MSKVEAEIKAAAAACGTAGGFVYLLLKDKHHLAEAELVADKNAAE